MMTRSFRALAALIAYPTAALQAATDEIAAALAEDALVPAASQAAIGVLLADLAGQDLYDLQERYGALFDHSRSLSLYLFEHVHGESRDRGAAMADLIDLYRRHGLEPDPGELPDFLPLFLEFLSLLPPDEARALLAEPVAILQTLADRLAARDCAYAAVFHALVALADAPAVPAPAADAHRADGTDCDDPDDLAALDVAWEEAAVRFGPGEPTTDGCGTGRLRTRLRAAARDVTLA